MNEGYSPLQSLSAMIVSSSFGNSYFLRGPAGLCVCVRLEKDQDRSARPLISLVANERSDLGDLSARICLQSRPGSFGALP
jgi:hypothetical protein